MLDYDALAKGFQKIVVGRLKADVIAALGLARSPCDIVMWGDRLAHIQRHLPDFQSEESFKRCVSKIPEIIDDPDYIGVHPTKNSIEFIKRIDELTIVAVRLRPKGELALRTVFPLSEKQLNDYLSKRTVIPYKKP